MHSSKMKMLGQLYMKDLHEIIPELVIVACGVVLVTVGYFLRASNDPNPVIVLPLMLLFGLAGLLPLVASFKLLSREWTNQTVYLIMSLPVSGWMVLGTKLLVLISQYIVGTLLIGGSAYLLYITSLYQFFAPGQPAHMLLQNPDLFKYMLAIYLSGTMFLIFLCCVSFLSQVVGKLSRKFSGLITAVTFIATLIISGRIMDIFGVGQYSANPIALRMMESSSHFAYSMNLTSLGQLLIAVLIFILAVVIYNKKLEL